MEDERPPRGLPKALLDLELAYSRFVAYGQSKMGNIWFSVSLTEALKELGVRRFNVHPGCESTSSFAFWFYWSKRRCDDEQQSGRD